MDLAKLPPDSLCTISNYLDVRENARMFCISKKMMQVEQLQNKRKLTDQRKKALEVAYPIEEWNIGSVGADALLNTLKEKTLGDRLIESGLLFSIPIFCALPFFSCTYDFCSSAYSLQSADFSQARTHDQIPRLIKELEDYAGMLGKEFTQKSMSESIDTAQKFRELLGATDPHELFYFLSPELKKKYLDRENYAETLTKINTNPNLNPIKLRMIELVYLAALIIHEQPIESIDGEHEKKVLVMLGLIKDRFPLAPFHELTEHLKAYLDADHRFENVAALFSRQPTKMQEYLAKRHEKDFLLLENYR